MSYSNYGCSCGSSCGCDCGCGPDYNPINVTNTPTVNPSSSSNPNNASNSATSVNLNVSGGGGGGGCCCCCGKPQEECCCKEGIKRVLQYLQKVFTEQSTTPPTLKTVAIFGDVVTGTLCNELGYLATYSDTGSTSPYVPKYTTVNFTNDTVIVDGKAVSLCSISFIRFVFDSTDTTLDRENINNALKEEFDNFIPASESGCCCQIGIDNYLYYQRVFLRGCNVRFTLDGVTSLSIDFATQSFTYEQYQINHPIVALDTDIVIVGPCVGVPNPNTLTYYAIPTCRIASAVTTECPIVPIP